MNISIQNTKNKGVFFMGNFVNTEKPLISVGQKIKRIRKMRGLTQKELGLAVGFDEESADIRIAQYESNTRTPKEKVVINIANALKVNPKALARSHIVDYEELIHTLFMLEDICGLQINSIAGVLCLTLDKSKRKSQPALFDMFNEWRQQAEKLEIGDITDIEYHEWKYNYRVKY